MRPITATVLAALLAAALAFAPGPPIPTVPSAPSPAAASSMTGFDLPPSTGGGEGDRYEAPAFLFGLTDDRTFETSGVVASSQVEDAFFVHNDSPTARQLPAPFDQFPYPLASDVHAVDAGGTLLRSFHLDGAFNRDWEDLARGPGLDGTGSALWIAEIGDNNRVWHDGITAYVLPEPDVDPTDRAAVTSVGPDGYDRVRFTYADGPHDAEAFLVHPVTGRVAVITKEAGADQVWVAPTELAPWPVANELALAGEFTVAAPEGTDDPRNSYGLVTGADWSPSGDRLVITTYRDLYEFDAVGDDAAATITAGPAARLLLPPEDEMSQVEAIGYTADGTDLVVVSEEGDNARARRPAYRFRGR